MARFAVDSGRGATVSAGAVYPESSLTRLPTGFDIATNIPVAINRDLPVMDTITNETPFQTFPSPARQGKSFQLACRRWDRTSTRCYKSSTRTERLST